MIAKVKAGKKNVLEGKTTSGGQQDRASTGGDILLRDSLGMDSIDGKPLAAEISQMQPGEASQAMLTAPPKHIRPYMPPKESDHMFKTKQSQ